MNVRSLNFLLLIIIWIWSCFTSGLINAQNKAFDPLLDSACKVIPQANVETWNGSYMWYPGMLSAHQQQLQKKKSEERCVNVGYPGNFMKPVNRTYFRKEVTLAKETEISWDAIGTVVLNVDGKAQESNLKNFSLTSGKHTLTFDVQTEGRLPALIVQGKGVEKTEGWLVSLDNHNWNIPETDTRYNKPSVRPDDDLEITATILPDKYIFLRNAENKNGNLVLGENGCLQVDFRHLEVGTVTVQASGAGNISFTVGESPEESLNEDIKDFEQRPIPPFTLTENIQEITLPERALRYLKISCDRPCSITSIRFDAKVWPVEFLMQFECDDKSLNNLWNAGVASLHTSMHNFYLDGVKRDYLPWSMDAAISVLGGDYVFGDRQVARNGISVSLMPPNPQVSDWGIVDYPLHALIALKQDYMRYGDLSTSLMFKDRILQQLALYESVLNTDGFLSAAPPTTGFIPGWGRKMGPDDYGVATYGQMLLYQNFVIGAYFTRLWKDEALAKHYEQKAKKLGENIVSHFWDNEKKAFINGYHANGEKDIRISHHAQYWGVLTGLYPAKYYDNLFDNVIPNIPFYKEYISYEKGYEFLAYVKAGRIKDMFTLLDEVWGDWLRQDNTRFPENFSLGAPLKEQLTFYERPFGLSLCHGANGVPPIVAVLHGIYGFSQSDKQISEYTLKPELINLNWVKGRIPVKEGYINISLTKQGACSIEIPENCVVNLYNGKQTKPIVYKKLGKYTFELMK